METPEENSRGAGQDPGAFGAKAEGAEMISEERFRRNPASEEGGVVSGEQKIQETSEVQPDDRKETGQENHQEIQHEGPDGGGAGS